MVSVGLCLLEAIATVETLFRISQQYALMLDNSSSTTEKLHQIEPLLGDTSSPLHQITVHHYARHGLCRTFDGQKQLYRAFKTKFCNMKLTFTAAFVIDLCRRRDHMLDKWVAELYDFDEDGYVTHYEKHVYNYAD